MFMALNFGVLMIINQLIDFMLPGEKTIRRIWHIDKGTHNSLLHTINNCLPIDLLLENDVLILFGIYLTALMNNINR